jgi:hypothetical protein
VKNTLAYYGTKLIMAVMFNSTGQECFKQMTNTDLDFLTGEVDNADREDVDETDDRRDGGLDRRTSLTSLTSSFGGSNSTRPFSKSSISSGVRRLMTTLHGFGRFGGG